MVIQIRGTSGSGKTTVMRDVMAQYTWKPHYCSGRKNPLYYTNDHIILLGHYENICGGCDTIGSAREVFELLQSVATGKELVLCEGLLLSEDVKWSSQIDDLKALFLTTSIQECLDRIGNRRREAGNNTPLKPRNTVQRAKTIERARRRLLTSGAVCRRCTSEQAPRIITKWIRIYMENRRSQSWAT